MLKLRRVVPLALVALVACPWAEGPAGDADRDGFDAGQDCDDQDPFVYPGATERCNGQDDNCDGLVDGPDATATTLWYRDADGDGFGEPDTAKRACEAPEGMISVGEDCDDEDASVHPGVPDGCDGVDSNCDGRVDENPDQLGYYDGDGDGHGGPLREWGCLGVEHTATSTDCDDGAPEVFPGAEERCNGLDDDCDGLADDEDPEGAVDRPTWFADADLDGFGDSTFSVQACVAPTGNLSLVAGDCDDRDAATHPGAFEGCEPVDRDCDGDLPDDDAWWNAAWPVRIPLELTALRDRPTPVLSVELDVGAAAGMPFDGRTLALVVQDCSVGAVRLDVEYTDGLGGVFDGAPTLPLLDGVGGVHSVLDRDLVAGEPVTLALYAKGPIASIPGDARASGEELESGSVTVTFDLVEGGQPQLVVDALADDPVVVGGLVGSPSVRGEAGILAASGFLPYGFGTVTPVQSGEMVAVADVVTPYEATQAGEAAVEQRIRWVAISGRDEVYGWVRQEVVAPGGVQLASPLTLQPGALRDAAVATVHPEGFASLSAPAAHLAMGWVRGPRVDAGAAVGPAGATLYGWDVALPGALLAGEVLVDEALFVVRGGIGPVDDATEAILDVLDPLDPATELVVGAPEAF